MRVAPDEVTLARDTPEGFFTLDPPVLAHPNEDDAIDDLLREIANLVDGQRGIAFVQICSDCNSPIIDPGARKDTLTGMLPGRTGPKYLSSEPRTTSSLPNRA